MSTPVVTEIARLRELVRDGWQPEYLFFWGSTDRKQGTGKQCLSQWYPAPFTVDGVEYATAEHFMMASKARLFGDAAALSRILQATTPAQAKKIGREVQGFDDERWKARRFDLVVEGNVAKFGQRPELRRFLLATGDRVLVEASPRDTIWGIGLAESDPRASDPARWRGLNLLGFALMVARASLDR